MDIALAIDHLVPQAKYAGSTSGNDRKTYEDLVWEDDRKKPTWEEIIIADGLVSTYREDRAAAYPEIGDQLDAIYKQLNYMRLQGTNLVEDADKILNKILQVKKDYPKGE